MPELFDWRRSWEVGMRADRVEVSLDADKKKWVVRIQVGEEVIRRSCDVPKDAMEPTIRSAAQEAIQNEGYEADATQLTIRR
ncbi:MAG: hypothetical protein LAO03_18510 [Acidobacteriia bacterium]|nr:hypothetical protein [Terriglobia bacterium]